MGVYIPNVSKPDDCGECDFLALCPYADGGMGVCSELIPPQIEGIHSDCPIEEIDLVRCGECKYIYTDEGVTLCGVWGKYTFKDGFCYQGERRADE